MPVVSTTVSSGSLVLPDGYAVSPGTPGQSEAVSSATVPDPALAISRLPLPTKFHELILKRALIGGLGAPGPQAQ